jgi:hypothetical protein
VEHTADYSRDDSRQNSRRSGVTWWYIGGIAIVAGTG